MLLSMPGASVGAVGNPGPGPDRAAAAGNRRRPPMSRLLGSVMVQLVPPLDDSQ